MRRAFTIGMVIVALAAHVLAPTAASGSSRVRHYEGSTSEGGRLSIDVVISDGVVRMSLLMIDASYRCEDGSEGALVDDGVGWVPKGPLINDGNLELSENWHSVAFMVSGRLGNRRGWGTLTFLLPAFTADRQGAQVCSTGELTWSVERTRGARNPGSRSPLPFVHADGGGRLMHAVGQGGPQVTPAPTQAGPIRQYRGRTSQDHPGEEGYPFRMPARTQRTDSGIAVIVLSFGYLLACADGTEVEGGIRPTAFFDAPQVMPAGRLDLAVAPRSGLGLAVFIELHGELDAHDGSGTLTMTAAALTDELDAQLCSTGDQTWRLWRTDAGF